MKRKPKIKIADLIRKDRGSPWPYRYDTGWVTVKDWKNMPAQTITVRVPAEWVRPYCACCGQAIPFTVKGEKK